MPTNRLFFNKEITFTCIKAIRLQILSIFKYILNKLFWWKRHVLYIVSHRFNENI
jgi:hypothetical protein